MKIKHSVIFTDKRHTVLDHEQRYAIGLIKPNYPMPAIRYEVSIASELVAVFNEQCKSISVWFKPKPWKYRKAWPKRG